MYPSAKRLNVKWIIVQLAFQLTIAINAMKVSTSIRMEHALVARETVQQSTVAFALRMMFVRFVSLVLISKNLIMRLITIANPMCLFPFFVKLHSTTTCVGCVKVGMW